MPINNFVHHPLSWTPDKQHLTRPLYKSLLAALKTAIEDGTLPPGTKLPPQRELADFLDVNFTTITRVYRLSAQLGLTYGITGKGTFVSPSGIDPLTISTPARRLIDLGFIASFEKTNYLLDTALHQVASLGASQLLTYANPTGRKIDKSACNQYLNSLGSSLLPEQHLLITSGGENTLTLLLTTLFSAGDLVAVDQFSYANFIATAKMLGIRLVAIANDDEGMLPADLERSCKINNISGLYLMPEYQNPTGTIISAQRRQDLATVAKRFQLKIIEDDYLSFLNYYNSERPPKFFQLLPQQTFYVCSMSKTIASGLRIAYLAFPSTATTQIENGFFNISVKTSTLNAAIATTAIQTGIAAKIIKEKLQTATKMNRQFDNIFPTAPQNQLTNWAFFRCLPLTGSTKTGKNIEQDLLKLHLRCFHSDRFATAANPDKQFLRVSLSATNSISELKTGLLRLNQYLVNHGLLS